jgi:hypothetical protein
VTASKTWPRLGLVLLGVVAIAEWAMAVASYRTRVTSQDFDAVHRALDPTQPAWLSTPWLGPRARMTVPALARLDSVARPDLRGVPSFATVGLGDRWSPELTADLEDLPMPRVVEQHTFGPLVLTTYAQPAAGTRLDDLLADPGRLRVAADDEMCKGQRRRWRCNLGAVELRTAEVDFRPRRCLSVVADDGVPVRIVVPKMVLGDTLRGHVGFHGFNARLRSDAVSEVTVSIDEVVAARWLVSDEEGWRPFAVRTPAGPHDVAIEIVSAARGTWGGDGYDPSRTHEPCIELRSFTDGGS